MTTETQGLLNQTGMAQVKWVPLHEVTEPGAYVSRDAGDLIRLSRSGGDGDTPDQGQEKPTYVTRISPDPFVAIGRLRLAAANLDLEIDF